MPSTGALMLLTAIHTCDQVLCQPQPADGEPPVGGASPPRGHQAVPEGGVVTAEEAELCSSAVNPKTNYMCNVFRRSLSLHLLRHKLPPWSVNVQRFESSGRDDEENWSVRPNEEAGTLRGGRPGIGMAL
ncbi:hypothetical protein JOB18_049443 [Solea senegalensis]|uniref:Uncharacterized protein n=1 Tax=Solea senegalensis TaxID=28829 RepID=A0AAV6RQ81_SOLSE|nr:hypothetical protein JOB18_049443 [Solea senegalensis]